MSPSAGRSAGTETVLKSNFQSYHKMVATELLAHLAGIKMSIPAGFTLQEAGLT